MSKATSLKTILTLDEAAGEYDVARSLIGTAASRGDLPFRQVGRTRMVDRADVEAWIRSRFVRQPQPEAPHDGAS